MNLYKYSFKIIKKEADKMFLGKTAAKRQADSVYKNIQKKLSEDKKSFYRDFFECAADEIYADIYDYFFDMRFANNVFKKSPFKLNEVMFRRFFKIMGGFYTINFINLRIDLVESEKLEEHLFRGYEFDEMEIKLYNIIKEMAENYKYDFMSVFVYALERYVLFMDRRDYFYLAFSANFCYNSYRMFCELFTRYESIEFRMNKYIS